MFKRSCSLADMCLVAVVRDIDLFVSAKTIPQKLIDFLFRAYSDEVFSKHKILKNFIDENCMLWFLNPYVKSLTIPANLHTEKIFQQLRIIASGITTLNLPNSKASEKDLNSIVCCLPNVVHLDLHGTSCSNRTLDCLGKSSPKLEFLNISLCENVTDDGMEILCDRKLSLKNLDISDSGVEGLGCAVILNRMPSLECVKYDDVAGLLYEIGFGRQYNLTELQFDNAFECHKKLIVACARMCPKLKKLHFKCAVSKETLKACVKFQNLEELKIKSTHGYNPFSNYLRNNDVLTSILPLSKNLKTLILSCMTVSVLTLVENFENLNHLYLKKVSFTSFEKKDIKITKTNLITFVVKDIDMEINDANYNAIALLISLSKNVTKLQINSIRDLPTEMLDLVRESMQNLTSVNFDYTGLKISSFKHLFEMPSLDTIKANCYEDDSSASNSLAKNVSCTLSWRSIYESEDEDEDGSCSNDNKHYYYDDSSESDVISDDCHSSDSDDRWYMPHF